MPKAAASRSTRLVSFSGMDGAGKSTQIQALRSTLEQGGLVVRVITFWDDVATLKQLREAGGHKLFRGDKGVGSPEAPINRRDKNVRSAPMTLVRFVLYTLDAISLRRVVMKALRSEVDFIICDRYAWDELANLTLSNPLVRGYIRCVAAIVPRPDVSYVLDADPVLARARKPEYPLEFLYLCRDSYLRLSRLIRGVTVIAPGSVEEVRQRIFERISLAGAEQRPRRLEGSPASPPA